MAPFCLSFRPNDKNTAQDGCKVIIYTFVARLCSYHFDGRKGKTEPWKRKALKLANNSRKHTKLQTILQQHMEGKAKRSHGKGKHSNLQITVESTPNCKPYCNNIWRKTNKYKGACKKNKKMCRYCRNNGWCMIYTSLE